VKSTDLFLGFGSLASGVGVGLGALGAHALRARLEPSALATFETAVQYQFLHGLAICVVGLWLRSSAAPSAPVTAAGTAFCVGILLFSGSLYALVLGGPRWLGPVTPLGGAAFLVGWACLVYAGFRRAFTS
jgi:uncharacterized membrane protein YgdD (TMEM256/DUF423 family)